MIIALVILSEKMTRVSLFSTIGSFIGIYLLTMNRPKDDGNQDSMLGYVLVFLSAWCFAIVFVSLRLMNLRGVHFFIGPFYIGVSALLTTLFMLVFFPHKLHIHEYDMTDFLMLS